MKEILKGIGGLIALPLLLLIAPLVLIWLIGRLVWSLFTKDDFLGLGDLL